MISKYNGDTSEQETDRSTVQAENTDTDNDILEKAGKRKQTTFDDSDPSIDSDMDWEEVDLVKDRAEHDAEDDGKPLDLVIGGRDLGSAKHHTPRRKADSAVEKKMRLEVHKTHLLCLLAHIQLRNRWCEDVEVQVCCLTSIVWQSIINPYEGCIEEIAHQSDDIIP